MEDKHVCIPDFNMLFNLEVKGTSEKLMRLKKHKKPSWSCFLTGQLLIYSDRLQ